MSPKAIPNTERDAAFSPFRRGFSVQVYAIYDDSICPSVAHPTLRYRIHPSCVQFPCQSKTKTYVRSSNVFSLSVMPDHPRPVSGSLLSIQLAGRTQSIESSCWLVGIMQAVFHPTVPLNANHSKDPTTAWLER